MRSGNYMILQKKKNVIVILIGLVVSSLHANSE
jgi:hypothetical protein